MHLANLPLPAVAARDRAAARRSIVEGTDNVLAAVAEVAPAARLVYVSSSMVYGDFTSEPQPESAPLRPRESRTPRRRSAPRPPGAPPARRAR